MKKLLIIFSMITVIFIAGCGDTSNNEPEKEQQNETPETEESGSKNEAEDENETDDANGSEENASVDATDGKLSLQVLKEDQEAGISIDNNELYQVLQAEIEADPLMGDPDDLSLFPYDIVEYEDGSAAILFLVINRLDNPIENLFMVLTFGNDEGDYIFDETQVDLPEEYMGVLEKDAAVPVLLNIEDEHIELFYTLTEDNVYLNVDDIGIDFVE